MFYFLLEMDNCYRNSTWQRELERADDGQVVRGPGQRTAQSRAVKVDLSEKKSSANDEGLGKQLSRGTETRARKSQCRKPPGRGTPSVFQEASVAGAE